ncbi:hypothetical protein N7454_009981 [Penicillium verhagenii]|uniref:uncharacterized protein n=1 Tax=Penicillium verhagenii TaxID=1562060 RepID=UPI00254549DC|nr:uncharacterized protein N7466_008905 [Penicillium verhagenii]KAJ5918837.1 hypothetical protein N7454_009981 [Penicillium verhagenii]KAJ5924718.1 hypothetical protein N7466_008905 [Penicillium verhagenii]
MALSACNAVVNPGFESGVLFPWRASAVDVAQVSTGTNAYSGDHYLSLQTAIDNQGNTISQTLKNLKPGKAYTFNAVAQVPYPSGSEYCFVYVYAGFNETVGEITSTDLYEETFGTWVSVSGTYVPKKSVESLHILAACDLEDNSDTGEVYLDAISLVPESGCASA